VWPYRRKLSYLPPDIKSFDRKWPPLLLAVSTELKRNDGKLLKALISASAYWNKKVGLPLFITPGEVGVSSNVISVVAASRKEDKSFSTMYTRYWVDERGTLSKATIFVKPIWKHKTVGELERDFVHALGHCLGLTHDKIHGSAMYGGELNGVYTVTDRDVIFLRSVYGLVKRK